jgi:hypothetical protein
MNTITASKAEALLFQDPALRRKSLYVVLYLGTDVKLCWVRRNLEGRLYLVIYIPEQTN